MPTNLPINTHKIKNWSRLLLSQASDRRRVPQISRRAEPPYRCSSRWDLFLDEDRFGSCVDQGSIASGQSKFRQADLSKEVYQTWKMMPFSCIHEKR